MSSEAQILREVEIAIGSLPDVWTHRNQVGFAMHQDRPGGVHYGLGKGSPDLVCLLKANGLPVMFGIEVKSAKGRLSIDQIRWRSNMLAHWGVRCFTVRSGSEALAAVEEMRRAVWSS